MGRIVLWLGAGFSRDAGGPLGGELLDDRFTEQSEAKPEAIAALKSLTSRNSQGLPSTVEDVFSRVWREANLQSEIIVGQTRMDARALLGQIRLHLSSVSRHVRPSPLSKLFGSYTALLEGIWQRNRRVTIITTNFDLLLERVLTKAGVPFDYGSGRSIVLRTPAVQAMPLAEDAKLHILKLHGSANWGICGSCRARFVYDREYLPSSKRRACESCPGKLEVDIVPPIKSKGAELRTLAPIWRLARQHLLEGDQLLVIGYSLPEADEDARELMAAAAPASIATKSTVISGSDVSVKARFAQTLPQATWTGLHLGEYILSGR